MADQEKYVVVTGGDRGIGKATALRFARDGFGIIITYASRRDLAEETANEALSSGASTAMYYQVDVSSWDSVSYFASQLSRTLPYVNVLVNNAGIIDYSSLEDVDLERWRRVIDVDLTGPFYVSKALLPLLRKAPWASIVNVSSIAGQTGNVVAGVAYVAAKAGLIGLTKKMAVELAKYRIRVNAVTPSFVETDMTRDYLSDPERRRQAEALHPLGSIAEPEDIAEAIYFLAIPQLSRNITGQVLGINGGRYT